MYGWIVDGITSLFEPVSGQAPTEWPGKGSGDIPTRAAVPAEGQRQSQPRAAKRNYQSVYVADNGYQNEQVEVKRRRRDVVLSFVKKTVAGVASLLRLGNPLSANSEKHRPCEKTQNGSVPLVGIDELHTSWTSSFDWKMDKPGGGLSERGAGNPFQSSSPPLMRKFSGVGLPKGNPERPKDRDKHQRSSLQLLPSRPALGLGTAPFSQDQVSSGLGHNRSHKPCLTVEEAIKENDKEHYRRLLEMVSEKYSKSQPLPFNRTKPPQDASLTQGEPKTTAFGRTHETFPRKPGPITATASVFSWRDASSTKQTRNRSGDVCFTKALNGTLDDAQHARYSTTAEMDLSTEVATRLKLVDRERQVPTQTETHSTLTSHLRHSEEDLPRLTKEMAAEVSCALAQRDPNLVLSAAFKLRITQRDLATLQENGWLNDEVINFYLSLMMERSTLQDGGLKVYSFSTFFFPKLQGGAGGGGGQAGGHAAVKRWTKAVDLFTYDLILVPLHLGVHWALAVIDFKSRSVKSYDSMGQRHDDICSLLLLYLNEEHKVKKGRDLDCTKWTVGSTRATEIPQQKNGNDCGVFACKYADYISRGRPLTFKQCHMPLFRKSMIWEILNQKLL